MRMPEMQRQVEPEGEEEIYQARCRVFSLRTLLWGAAR